jgi:outer membrane receptor protein involved in Fe transport
VKSTVYIDRALGETWKVRGQFMHSGRQSRFPNNPAVFGQADVEAYSLLDVSISGQLGKGVLALAVNNALNEAYYTPDSWRYANSAYFSQGQGATMRMTYTVTY